jgi:hypothetical protein
MLIKCFMKSVMFIAGLAVVAIVSEIIADALSADCRRIGSSTRCIRIRGCRP